MDRTGGRGPDIAEEEARRWLAGFRSGWIERDPQRILALFTPNVDYRERRFGRPLRNHDSLEDYWRARLGSFRSEVDFDFQLWAVKGNEAYAGWQARFVWLPVNGFMQLDGVFRLAFVRAGFGLLCSRFDEWVDHRQS